MPGLDPYAKVAARHRPPIPQARDETCRRPSYNHSAWGSDLDRDLYLVTPPI
ncbi:hypothetical protein AB0K60_27270 [Thermopolyspora sp. NPDC052614]|uniref:hypothetical protein n=1 Tax=Thermopolyspora sp. NPDC052614 TaxID=3155682 RepID=UPI003441C355